MRSIPALCASWLRIAALCASALMTLAAAAAHADTGEQASGGPQLWVTEGNRLRRLDLADGSEHIVIEHASLGEEGRGDRDRLDAGRRDVNGMICALPDDSGRFVLGEDSLQPDVAPGWGVFTAEGEQVGKLVPTYLVLPGEPYGCAFDDAGRLFTTDVGNKSFGAARGQLLLWFPPFAGYPGGDDHPTDTTPGRNFCKLASDIATAGGVAVDGRGRVYVASASGLRILRFSPPFPTAPDAAGGCGGSDASGAPMADRVERETFAWGLYTYSGLALHGDRLFAASVLTGEILEYDLEGRLVREILDPPGLLPPFETGTPQGLAVGPDGTLYYTDLDLVWDGLEPGPGPDGKLWRIRFSPGGIPEAPELLRDGLAFPDGVAVAAPAAGATSSP